MKKLFLPLDNEKINKLTAGETVLICGELLTARDAAHKRLASMIEKKEKLPFDLKGKTIYYTGPCPSKKGVIGSCGPTTSFRVDTYTPLLLDMGLKGMIGKGERGEQVNSCIIINNAVYFAAIGGAGALYSMCVKKAEVLCFEELGAEAIYKLYVEDFPALVAYDSKGGSIYQDINKK